MSEPTTPATPTTPAASPTKKLITQAAAIIAALAGGFAVAKFSDTHNGPAPVGAVDNAPGTNVAAPGKPQRQIQVVNLFDCQYIVTENPFFMVHLPRCTNHPAGK